MEKRATLMTIQERLEKVQVGSGYFRPPGKENFHTAAICKIDYDALLRAFRHLYQEVKGEIQSSSSPEDYAQIITRMDDEILQVYEGKK